MIDRNLSPAEELIMRLGWLTQNHKHHLKIVQRYIDEDDFSNPRKLLDKLGNWEEEHLYEVEKFFRERKEQEEKIEKEKIEIAEFDKIMFTKYFQGVAMSLSGGGKQAFKTNLLMAFGKVREDERGKVVLKRKEMAKQSYDKFKELASTKDFKFSEPGTVIEYPADEVEMKASEIGTRLKSDYEKPSLTEFDRLENNRRRFVVLHRNFDELLAGYLSEHAVGLNRVDIQDLMAWSYRRTLRKPSKADVRYGMDTGVKNYLSPIAPITDCIAEDDLIIEDDCKAAGDDCDDEYLNLDSAEEQCKEGGAEDEKCDGGGGGSLI